MKSGDSVGKTQQNHAIPVGHFFIRVPCMPSVLPSSLGPLGLVPATGLLFFLKKCASHHFFCRGIRPALEEKRPVRRYCLDVRRQGMQPNAFSLSPLHLAFCFPHFFYTGLVERPLCLRWRAKRCQSKPGEAGFDSRESSRGTRTRPSGRGAQMPSIGKPLFAYRLRKSLRKGDLLFASTGWSASSSLRKSYCRSSWSVAMAASIFLSCWR